MKRSKVKIHIWKDGSWCHDHELLDTTINDKSTEPDRNMLVPAHYDDEEIDDLIRSRSEKRVCRVGGKFRW